MKAMEKIKRIKHLQIMEKINRIKRLQIMEKRKRIKHIRTIVFSAVTLLSSVSMYGLMARQISEYTKNFDRDKVIIDKDTLTLQKFYEKLNYNNAWFLEMSDGKVINVDSAIDYRWKDSAQYRYDTNIEIKHKIDTVYVRYSDKKCPIKGKKYLAYSMKDTGDLNYMPMMGKYSHGHLLVRYYQSSNPKIQKYLDEQYNYGQTGAHEMWHFHNICAGITLSGQSYELKYCECVMDEISANLKQLLAQRKFYLENDSNIEYLSKKFPFYYDAVASGQIKPDLNKPLSKEEKQFITQGIYDYWMNKNFDMYASRIYSRTKHILRNANYFAVQENSKKNNQLFQNMFNIDGIDFHRFFYSKRFEVIERISPIYREKFAAFKSQKKKNLTYLDRKAMLEKEKYNKDMEKHVIWAKLRKYMEL